MVNKIAVMALVGIFAVPILLGYGLNLSEVSVTEYTTDGEPINVTPLLQNGTNYTYAHGDMLQMNSNFVNIFRDWQYVSNTQPTTPIFESITSVKTSYPMQKLTINNWSDSNLSLFDPINIKMIYDENIVSLTGALRNGNTTVSSFDNIKELYYDASDSKLYVTYISTVNGEKRLVSEVLDNIGANYTMVYTRTPNTQNVVFEINRLGSSTNTYVDISAGYHFVSVSPNYYSNNQVPQYWSIDLPQNTRSALLTVNLDSVTDNTYGFNIGAGYNNLSLQKMTDSGNVIWSVFEIINNGSTLRKVTDLYYDQSRSDNTYQIELSLEEIDSSHEKFTAKFNYVGGWPVVIGQANSFMSYEYEHDQPTYNDPFTEIRISNVRTPGGYVAANTILTRTPTMRIDDAYFRAFEYPVISNKEYNPADFKENPLTVVTNVDQYGSSITFGGNTYQVDKSGNITLGVHKVPVKNIEFKSIPTSGGFENKIGDTTISTTSEPSTITFNGNWGAIITTTTQQATQTSKLQWTSGQFAWDGIDDNFLIVGLITCIGVFIGLGIYARSHRMSIWPLLLVCGGAAALFIFMI